VAVCDMNERGAGGQARRCQVKSAWRDLLYRRASACQV